ncbi:hypothetical protein KKA87_11590 [bacterium]|nr:hypothetical protein [bacterium]MBU1872169.1 hypothetical protein [bacterium]
MKILKETITKYLSAQYDKAKRIIISPAFLALFLAGLVESQYYHIRHLKNMVAEPITTIIFFAFLYIVGLLVAEAIFKIFTSFDSSFDGQIKSNVEEIVTESKRYLYIVSPYISPGNLLVELILKAAKSGIKVTVIHHSSQLSNPDLLIFLRRLIEVGGEMYHHPKIHAKIYMNESSVLITSMNLITSSFDNSFESGIYTSYYSIRKECTNYIKNTILDSDLIKKTIEEDFNIKTGYCIRTGVEIPFNSLKPVEYKAYLSSGQNRNGKYCHFCGEKADTSVLDPFCEKHKNIKE